MLLVTYLLVICSYPSITFLGGCTLLLVYNWLLVICSYAGTNFSVLFLALRGQPPRRVFVLTWLRLPGFYLFIGLFLFYFGCLSYVVMQAPFSFRLLALESQHTRHPFVFTRFSSAGLYLFIGSSLFIIWLLVICSYAHAFFRVIFLALMGQPTRQLFALTWSGLPGYINF